MRKEAIRGVKHTYVYPSTFPDRRKSRNNNNNISQLIRSYDTYELDDTRS